MAWMNSSEKKLATTMATLAYANPFLPERIELEREALGEDFIEWQSAWSKSQELDDESPNLILLLSRCDSLAEKLRARLLGGIEVKEQEWELYEDLVLFILYHRFADAFKEQIARAAEREAGSEKSGPQSMGFYSEFDEQATYFLSPGSEHFEDPDGLAHLFAIFFQIRRAFHQIFDCIIGESKPVMLLRAAVWQSIFSHDMRRYRRLLFDRLGDLTCLITGPSGTGKELVARAVGLSRYIPFDPVSQSFAEDFSSAFFALNLSELSPGLIESELFGHQKGAFTGAVKDRAGWLERCPPLGAVFLDEIGELEISLQIKLLRVLQNRTFQRVGGARQRRFEGKIIAATNRDLITEIEAGRFREDLYYRLCSDLIVTPSLHEQLRDSPDAIRGMVAHIAQELIGEAEAPSLADETVEWIEKNLGLDYSWPGNVRELEQCMRNILIRQSYRPVRWSDSNAALGPRQALADNMQKGQLNNGELLRQYYSLIYSEAGSYQESARRLEVDHRTVKAHVDMELVESFRSSTSSG